MTAAAAIGWELVSDGAMTYPREFVFANADPRELDAEGVPSEVTTPFNALLVRSGSRLVLVDGGLGALADVMQVPAGRLVASLASLGVEPADVDDVVVTHAHADHVGGLLTGDAPTFARARHHLARAEWDFWMEQDPRPLLQADLADSLVDVARRALDALDRASLLSLVDGAADVVPGVRVEPAPGHTPGHLVVEVATPGAPMLLYLTDTLLHELEFQHLDWVGAVDVDGARVAQTRARLFDRAARDAVLVTGFHLPAVGHVTAAGDAYRFTAAR